MINTTVKLFPKDVRALRYILQHFPDTPFDRQSVKSEPALTAMGISSPSSLYGSLASLRRANIISGVGPGERPNSFLINPDVSKTALQTLLEKGRHDPVPENTSSDQLTLLGYQESPFFAAMAESIRQMDEAFNTVSRAPHPSSDEIAGIQALRDQWDKFKGKLSKRSPHVAALLENDTLDLDPGKT